MMTADTKTKSEIHQVNPFSKISLNNDCTYLIIKSRYLKDINLQYLNSPTSHQILSNPIIAGVLFELLIVLVSSTLLSCLQIWYHGFIFFRKGVIPMVEALNIYALQITIGIYQLLHIKG
jgi:hypothetical protein